MVYFNPHIGGFIEYKVFFFVILEPISNHLKLYLALCLFEGVFLSNTFQIIRISVDKN